MPANDSCGTCDRSVMSVMCACVAAAYASQSKRTPLKDRDLNETLRETLSLSGQSLTPYNAYIVQLKVCMESKRKKQNADHGGRSEH